MGNHRFRLSDMIPNSWFQKLKHMGTVRNQNTNHFTKKKPSPTSSKSTKTTSSSSSSTSIPPKTKQPKLVSHQRKSYYFTRELTSPSPQPPNPKSPETRLLESPRKSTKQRKRLSTTKNRRNRAVTTSSVSTGCSCRVTVESVSTNPDSTSEDYPISPLDSSSDHQSVFPEFCSDHDNEHGISSCPSSCQCRVQNDVVLNLNEKSPSPKFDGFIKISELELPPIVTKKPTKFPNECEKPTNQLEKSEKQRNSPVRSPGVRLRTNSPRIASRKMWVHGRKSVSSSGCRSGKGRLSESFAVVKTSADPQRDFRESMVEMILENNLRASKDLEDLLACYLQLNADEYHELIVEVFKQIWFDIAGVKMK